MRTADEALFEEAADRVVDGDVEALAALLERHPRLVHAHSARAHRGTLLHYAATNGVEDERQRVPLRAPEITRLLIARGADIHAEGAAYGGGTTPLVALLTSIHPLQAGVMAELVDTFADSGQSLEGPHDDGQPLLMALLFRNLVGARALVERGARRENAVVWAALGETEALEGALRPGAPPTADPPRAALQGSRLGPVETLEWALIAAASTGARASVDLLIGHGVALDARWSHGTTALHEAAWAGHPGIVERLLEAGASADVRDRHHQSTPAGWARHAGHEAIAARLEAETE